MLRVKNGFTYQQVSNELKEICPGERGLLHLPLNVFAVKIVNLHL